MRLGDALCRNEPRCRLGADLEVRSRLRTRRERRHAAAGCARNARSAHRTYRSEARSQRRVHDYRCEDVAWRRAGAASPRARGKPGADLSRGRSFGARRHRPSRRRILLSPRSDRAQISVHPASRQRRAHRSHYLYASDHEGCAASANRQNLRRFHSHRRRSRYPDARGYNLSEVNKAQFPQEQAADGSFKRQEDAFRDWVTADGSSGYPAQAGRYHLYVSLACPWACRTVIVRTLKGLETAIGMTVVDPIRDERGWRFTAQPDPLNGWAFLSEAYTGSDRGYDARVTVPVLWDKERGRIVSNSDDDIMRMFETQLDAIATNPQLDLYPDDLRPQIDELNDFLYETFTNGV